jgi:hypothetical protein
VPDVISVGLTPYTDVYTSTVLFAVIDESVKVRVVDPAVRVVVNSLPKRAFAVFISSCNATSASSTRERPVDSLFNSASITSALPLKGSGEPLSVLSGLNNL